MVIIFWDILMFDQTFLSTQVKLGMIISNEHGMYELAHEVSNDLRLKILKNLKLSGKFLNFIELYPST